ncbi:unnamed protein product, partial [Mesorhabditis belari]|uniref:BHLH domain-containing protein n=1 Tax=Mesorhabditis belari TaxID=2138241 RepID=A0AAF3FI21_9BILA
MFSPGETSSVLYDIDEQNRKLSKAERRKRRRATPKYRNLHASRERRCSIRVESFNVAFAQLRALLPTLPIEKKLSKIEILRLSIAYISYLNKLLDL